MEFLSQSEGFLVAAASLFLLVAWYKRKGPAGRGRRGERFVERRLDELDPTEYKILNDVLLPSSGNLPTTQIDHVVISRFGVFVLETKFFKGWIFGRANEPRWTQVIYRYKAKFYNPIYQNYAHTEAVGSIILSHFPKTPVVGFVIFPIAKRLQIAGTDKVGNVQDTLKKIQSYTRPILSYEDRDKIVELISGAHIMNLNSRKDHVKNVQEFVKLRQYTNTSNEVACTPQI